MTIFQLVALAILSVVVVVNYVLPNVRLPSKKPSTMRQIEQVLAIRESSVSPKVKAACQELLQALLQ